MRSKIRRCVLLALSCLPLPPLQAEERPNIVFLLVDDLRWNALGFMGNSIVQTPNLDRLAKEGIVFDQAFVTTSICSVSRASIFTGQWKRRHGIVDFHTGLTPEQRAITYPVLLRGQGYQTGLIGKYGVGSAEVQESKREDFDFWEGRPGQGGKHFIDPDDPTRTHSTAKYGNHALEFLRSVDPEKPFHLSVSFNAVHARDNEPREFEPDPRDEELYKDITIPLPPTATVELFGKLPGFVKESEGRRRWFWRFDEPEKAQSVLRDYYRLITGVDREVGRILQILEERGIADRTVILFTSDNGFALGDRGLADKWFFWEEDIRVPLLIRDPRLPKERQGARVSSMVLNVDLAPTMLDLAGIEAPAAMQGRSLVPLIKGENPTNWRTEYFYEHHSVPSIIPQVEGVRTKRWKYIRWIKSDPLLEELYDLREDPLETNNLANDAPHQEVLEELRGKWAAYGETLK